MIITILNGLIVAVNATLQAIDTALGPFINFGGISHIPLVPNFHTGVPNSDPNPGGGGRPGDPHSVRVRPLGGERVRDVHLHIEPKHALVDGKEAVRELDWAMRTSGW